MVHSNALYNSNGTDQAVPAHASSSAGTRSTPDPTYMTHVGASSLFIVSVNVTVTVSVTVSLSQGEGGGGPSLIERSLPVTHTSQP
jgi:hypothetical protein